MHFQIILIGKTCILINFEILSGFYDVGILEIIWMEVNEDTRQLMKLVQSRKPTRLPLIEWVIN